jgi:hypothetical protein
MKEVLRSVDPVFLSWACDILTQAGMEPHVFDQNISLTEAGLAIFPRRLMVANSQAERAARLLRAAEAALD